MIYPIYAIQLIRMKLLEKHLFVHTIFGFIFG